MRRREGKPLFGSTAYLEDEAIIEQTKAHARQTIQQHIALLDARLEGRDWLVTDKPTPADAYLFVIHTWMQFLGIDLSALENVNAHFTRISAEPVVQRVLACEVELMSGLMLYTSFSKSAAFLGREKVGAFRQFFLATRR